MVGLTVVYNDYNDYNIDQLFRLGPIRYKTSILIMKGPGNDMQFIRGAS